MFEQLTARGLQVSPVELLSEKFPGMVEGGHADALFTDGSMHNAVGVSGLAVKAPVTLELLKHAEIARYLLEQAGSLLVMPEGNTIRAYQSDGQVKELPLPKEIGNAIACVITSAASWAGAVNSLGEHEVDLRTPSPGPHFNVNLLMGNRMGYGHALQTTPKSVVDRLGRGSFRSHAAMQVLATRWDMRPEENGFPANRQFYLTEDCREIFYSADPNHENILKATCTHSQNRTVIRYETRCGLAIKREIFVLPQKEGEPIAVEAQRISIKNQSLNPRKLRLVYTGMFGTSADHAVFEDVVYSNVIMQARVFRRNDGIAAISPDYYPEFARQDVRFHTMLAYAGGKTRLPDEFCANYNEFVGSGTLESPEGLLRLSNNLSRKGPGFFALACELAIAAGEETTVGNFSGIVSSKDNPSFSDETAEKEIGALVSRFSDPEELERELNAVIAFEDRYNEFLQVKSSDSRFDAYVNRNLPFQIRYQTFVSRSFCQTQKGHREIGFREIQDVFASMNYFSGMGCDSFVRQLLLEWCAKVFEFGFAYHNFYWVGKEPGMWSDDALWFIQAVSRYIRVSGDMSLLDEQCVIAGTEPARSRTVLETMLAILRYSGEISVGRHGMPLLDRADWNDCLALDSNYLDGIAKEKAYRKQIEDGGAFGEPLKSDYSESVMNAFLLKIALDETVELAQMKGGKDAAQRLAGLSAKLNESIQTHAWKGDFFARVLLNRYKNGEFTYLGAADDTLSADPAIGGTYFLNSFSWAVLCGAASEEQVGVMLDSLDKYLKTPYGIKLMSPAKLDKLASGTATGHYYPGDRENGAVFKHASMMAVAAMLKAAKTVRDSTLAARLATSAYWMIDLVLPYRTMEHPYETCGNPRFCTQYNNSETGENIGPMLSGTATWLGLALQSAFGVEPDGKGIALDPILREEQEQLDISIKLRGAGYNIRIEKPKGFRRVLDGGVAMKLDGKPIAGNLIPLFTDGGVHRVLLWFR